jgi:hypothetical protein
MYEHAIDFAIAEQNTLSTCRESFTADRVDTRKDIWYKIIVDIYGLNAYRTFNMFKNIFQIIGIKF